jgi:hypothetical protein
MIAEDKRAADDGGDLDARAAVIGDVVGSRGHLDRGILQGRLTDALERTNALVPAVQPLVVTVGDEFQGLYEDVASALDATLFARLALLGDVDVRFGVGWGTLEVYDASRAPFAQDGPAWWTAREAVERAAAAAKGREAARGSRTAFVGGSGQDGGRAGSEGPGRWRTPAEEDLVNAVLVCRDEIVWRMDARDARLAMALFAGEKQAVVAAREGVTQSAVSQRLVRSGAHALRRTRDLLRRAVVNDRDHPGHVT